MDERVFVVGAGFYGATFARVVADRGWPVTLIDGRDHIGGNSYTREMAGVTVHAYGPHLFHTSDRRVWEFLNRFATFNGFQLHGRVTRGGGFYSFPLNLKTLNEVWGVTSPEAALAALEEARRPFQHCDHESLEGWCLSQVGQQLYEMFVKGYTQKQWGQCPSSLPARIIKRLPVRLTWDSRYFTDQYQGVPVGGYTPLFEKMLDHPLISVELNAPWDGSLPAGCRSVVYSGSLDELCGYSLGPLPYRSLMWDHQIHSQPVVTGCPLLNYPEPHVAWTRTIEHKLIALNETSSQSVVTREVPIAYEVGGPHPRCYPIESSDNRMLFEQYQKLAAEKFPSMICGGRLASYRYMDMHQVVAQAMKHAHDFLEQNPR